MNGVYYAESQLEATRFALMGNSCINGAFSEIPQNINVSADTWGQKTAISQLLTIMSYIFENRDRIFLTSHRSKAWMRSGGLDIPVLTCL